MKKGATTEAVTPHTMKHYILLSNYFSNVISAGNQGFMIVGKRESDK